MQETLAISCGQILAVSRSFGCRDIVSLALYELNDERLDPCDLSE